MHVSQPLLEAEALCRLILRQLLGEGWFDAWAHKSSAAKFFTIPLVPDVVPPVTNAFS
jgi:hypothetical protein